MRKLIPILATLLVLILGFFVYLHFQPNMALISNVQTPVTEQDPNLEKKEGVMVGDGKSPWVLQFDRQGHLAYRFKSDFYGNNPDGTIPVIKPVIEIFQADGSVINIEGVDGVIRAAPGETRVSFSDAPHAPPRSGTLRTVVVRMYGSIEAQLKRPQSPDLTLTMSNAQFDNDTFRLFTQEYTDPSGKVIHADEVPVTLNAADYAFDGAGLVMFWNGMDQQLKSLEIEHGNKLTINNADEFAPGEPGAASAKAPPNSATPPAADPSQMLTRPAPSVPSGVEKIQAAPTTASDKVTAPKRYQATFFDDVHVVQAGQEIKNAQQMQVDFIPKGNPGPPQVGAPSTNSAPVPVAPVASQAPVSSAGPAATGAEAAPVVAPVTPATRPGAQPIEITWKGKMRMEPVEDPNAEPLAPDQRIVRFIGSPVRIHQSASADQPDSTDFDVQCARIVYRTANSIVNLLAGPQVPVTLTQKHADGTVSAVTTQGRMQFSRASRIANIDGPSDAQFPDPNDPTSVLTADWSNTCRIHLLADAKGQMQVQSADLTGNVTVKHPRFELNSSALNLGFDSGIPSPASTPGAAPSVAASPDKSPANSPQLKEILATGDARCIVHETDNRVRSISGQTLRLLTARGTDGKVFAKTIYADGSAQAIQDKEDLTSEHLEIGLRPIDPARRAAAAATRPDASSPGGDVELDTLYASDNVKVKGADSAVAADDLKVERVNGFSRVTLHGKPAVVSNKDSTISGPAILLSSENQTSSVEGPGTLIAAQQAADASGKSRPLRIDWKTRAALDSKANKVEVFGEVKVESKTPGGADDTGDSDHLILTLADKPAAQAASAPSATQPADSALAGGEFDFMRDKEVHFISLVDKARIESSLTDTAGTLQRRSKLWGNKIDYDPTGQVLTVPGMGNMSVEDYEVSAPPAGAAPSAPGAAGGFHGQTVFDWQKQFIFDQTKRIGVIQGKVIVVHRDYTDKAQPVRLDAESVAAEFEPVPVPAGAVAPTTRPGEDENPHLQIRKMVAVGVKGPQGTYIPVKIVSGDTKIYCGQVEFDPKTQHIICRGADAGEVIFSDAQHRDAVTADQVYFNTRTNTIDKITDLRARGRK